MKITEFGQLSSWLAPRKRGRLRFRNPAFSEKPGFYDSEYQAAVSGLLNISLVTPCCFAASEQAIERVGAFTAGGC